MQIERKAPARAVKKATGEQSPKKPFAEVLKQTSKQANARPSTRAGGRDDRAPASIPEGGPSTAAEEAVESTHRPPVGRRSADEERATPAEQNPLAPEGMAAPNPDPRPVVAEGAEDVGSASAVATVQALADEIVEIAGPDGVRELQVEVDSSVIGDLRISVQRDDRGELVVRLMTDSAQTTKLLQDNLGQLSAALSARSIQAAAIQVTPRINPAASAAAAKSQRERDRRERGRR